MFIEMLVAGRKKIESVTKFALQDSTPFSYSQLK